MNLSYSSQYFISQPKHVVWAGPSVVDVRVVNIQDTLQSLTLQRGSVPQHWVAVDSAWKHDSDRKRDAQRFREPVKYIYAKARIFRHSQVMIGQVRRTTLILHSNLIPMPGNIRHIHLTV